MAEGGIPKLVDNVVSGLSGFRGTGQVGQRRVGQASGAAGNGAPQDGRSRAAPRQIINFEGQQFDRYAPRGTYLNLLV